MSPVWKHQPSLRTERLRLRPFVASDAPALQELAGSREVADTALTIAHPYTEAAAKTWIASQTHSYRNNTSIHFAVALPGESSLVGSVELQGIDRSHAQAELRLWIGKPWWGEGYGTEAAQELIRFGFEEFTLNRIWAMRLARDRVAAKLLARLGMQEEGLLRQRARKWDLFEDVALHAILQDEHKL